MKVKSENVEEKYKKLFEKAANGCWYVEQYFIISHLEMREARNPQYDKMAI